MTRRRETPCSSPTPAPNELLLHQLILSPAFGLTTLDSKKVEDMKGEYRSLEARKSTLPASGKKRLRELHDELIDFPEWTRPTEEDRKQVELLEEIHRVLKDGAGGPPKGPGRKRRADRFGPRSTMPMTRLERVPRRGPHPRGLPGPRTHRQGADPVGGGRQQAGLRFRLLEEGQGSSGPRRAASARIARRRPPPSPTATSSTSGPRTVTGGWLIAMTTICLHARSAIKPTRARRSRWPVARRPSAPSPSPVGARPRGGLMPPDWPPTRSMARR